MTDVDISPEAVERMACILDGRGGFVKDNVVVKTLRALSAALQQSEARLNHVEADMSQHVCHEDALQKSQATIRRLETMLAGQRIERAQKPQAETAVAYERAAQVADKMAASAKARIDNKSPADADKVWGMLGCAEAVAASIRALKTLGQTAALDAVKAKAFALGVAQARLSVSRHMDWNPATVRDDILLNIDMSCGVTTTPKGGA